MGEISYGSLCTGYDGLGEALRLAGLPIVPRWFAENEPAMGQVLAAEYPGVVNVGDVKTTPWTLAPHTDLMSSGDPCQSISSAGRQQGRLDPRFLWPWVREAYRAVRPGGIFFENVGNIVSHDQGRTLAERFEHLREDGYAVRWTVLGACAVGAPHHRHRWYALAGYVGAGAPPAVRVGGDKAICGAPRSGGRFLLPTPPASDLKGPGIGRMAQGKLPWADLASAVALLPSPQARDGRAGGLSGPEYAAGRLESGRRNLDDAVSALLLPTPTAVSYGNNQGGSAGRVGPVRHSLESLAPLLPTPRATDLGTPGRRSSEGWRPQLGQAVQAMLPTPTATNAQGNQYNGETPPRLLLPGIAVRPEVYGKYAEAVALWEAITGVPAPVPTEPGKNGGTRLSAALPEWMMGLRPGMLTDRLPRRDALKGAGNGVVPQAAAAAYRLLAAAS
jgi:DNA (cytosine-5)-methyltransferase 1